MFVFVFWCLFVCMYVMPVCNACRDNVVYWKTNRKIINDLQCLYVMPPWGWRPWYMLSMLWGPSINSAPCTGKNFSKIIRWNEHDPRLYSGINDKNKTKIIIYCWNPQPLHLPVSRLAHKTDNSHYRLLYNWGNDNLEFAWWNNCLAFSVGCSPSFLRVPQIIIATEIQWGD